ncbi:MAG: ArsC/Spx/MgsR family protein [Micromonosporaceae bacterium]
MEIWYNPACSKCRTAAQRLEVAGLDVGIRRYLDDPPSAEEFDAVLRRLGRQPWDIARLAEPVAERLGLAEWPREDAARARWIDAMVANPVLIQRPILLFDDGGAVIGRTPEALEQAVGGADGPTTGSS